MLDPIDSPIVPQNTSIAILAVAEIIQSDIQTE